MHGSDGAETFQDDLSNEFWASNQPGFRFSNAPVGSREFFREVEDHRYTLEPHIPEVVGFERWRDRDVLEAGCGIATDGARFARAGARYTGVDLTSAALRLARARFQDEGLEGTFVQAPVTALPFEDSSFDLVYSHGVVHHVSDTQRAIDEFLRVLRPGGKAIVMVYHRNSLNYRFTIMALRRGLVATLMIPGAGAAIARITGESPALLREHKQLLRRNGLRYLTDRELFLARNTDGPGNPLSKVYSRREAVELFRRFETPKLTVRHLNLRIYPGGSHLAATRIGRILERRIGWFLYVEATKPDHAAATAGSVERSRNVRHQSSNDRSA